MENKKTRNYPVFLEIIPILAFLVLNKFYGIFFATGSLMVLSILSLVISYMYTKTWHAIAIITVIFAIVFGGLTLFFNDDHFIKIKVTLINVIFALIMISDFFIKKNFVKKVLNNNIQLEPKGYKILRAMWILFFVFLAILNELIWRNYDTDTWVNFKVFGIGALSVIYALIQLPIIKHYSIKK